jgi:pimeloyl-ACP methyl ester carboxylesterase
MPMDVTAVIDFMLGDFENSTSVDGGNVAVVGHSLGAFASLVTAAGLPGSPYGGDDRVKAIVPMPTLRPSLSPHLTPYLSLKT